MKLYQGPVFIDGMVNSTEVVVHFKTNFWIPNSVVVPETIDAVRQLILQDRNVTYREIETTLGISGTSIHSMNLIKFLAMKLHQGPVFIVVWWIQPRS